MADLLSEHEQGKALGTLPAWNRVDGALVREVELASFPEAIAVVNRVAEVAENNDHHPDIDIRWRTLKFTVTTHSAGGITALDVSLAAEIDGILDATPQP